MLSETILEELTSCDRFMPRYRITRDLLILNYAEIMVNYPLRLSNLTRNRAAIPGNGVLSIGSKRLGELPSIGDVCGCAADLIA